MKWNFKKESLSLKRNPRERKPFDAKRLTKSRFFKVQIGGRI